MKSLPRLSRLPVTLLAGAFVVLVCMSLISIDGWRSWHAREIQMGESVVATSNLARTLAQHADDTFKDADAALVGLVERLSVDGTSATALDRLHRYLMNRVTESPQLQGIFVYDENGKWLVNSQKVVAQNLNNSDREYFVYHRTHTELTAHVGPPIQSRSTGKWILTLSRRVNHGDGSFGGVVLATIDVEYFRKFYDSIDIGKLGASILGLDNGTMLIRRPSLEKSIGKSIKDGDLFRDYIAKNDSGTAMILSNQDGIERLIAYRHLKRYPMFVTASLAKSEILAEWQTDTYLHTTITLLLICVLGWLGFHLVSQIRLRVDAEVEARDARDKVETLNRTLEKLALQDGLTGLANRRRFDIVIEEELRKAKHDAGSLAVVMIDVDNFKRYNDIYGHPAGDDCLRKIAGAVKISEKRIRDLAARYGGEEMAIVLPDSDIEGAMRVAESVRLAVRNLRIPHAENTSGIVTISAGVSARTLVRRDDTAARLIDDADKSLYVAKNTGRDRVCFFPEVCNV
ncbi:response regulator receiver modulated diguanylate cyclase [Collimonas arenae]|uniref:diguanylate cyclase n=1 Tax=Collimonas arenae TaxID=279058 RepID=A0A0A1FHD9_9BURK|nr:GGDEF domain-containing protein [Collimonas arenae]AIY42267.1 response regulator receiver modulated diguanylate cyclase [Collimonas arenae]